MQIHTDTRRLSCLWFRLQNPIGRKRPEMRRRFGYRGSSYSSLCFPPSTLFLHRCQDRHCLTLQVSSAAKLRSLHIALHRACSYSAAKKDGEKPLGC
ncbi:uncharacterized protein PgNI_01520 [Pyricularia grisea]|uniref:Uncharacterized protein n=1 Tax=Pyricularia grisea TaxID=148305 RepID=A0A6P8BMK2_PYRGI|nr:uncharacterized protein PgNI_01520 [Pyricularia grisea]TLD17747.1 hypothetical protein PgNI_01520 [Pyricularia grisea]